MAAVANTSSGPRNVLRNSKAADLTNPHSLQNPPIQQFIRPVPSSMIGKQNIGDETREACNQDYSPCSCDSAVSDDNITIINSVSCVEVSVQTVRDVFLRVNDAEIHALELSRLVTAADNIQLYT